MKKLFKQNNKVVGCPEDIGWIMFLMVESVKERLNVNINWYSIKSKINTPTYFYNNQTINKLISK